MRAFERIRIVLFDLGGVLLDLKDPIDTFGVDFDEAEFYRRWLLSPSVRQFEIGKTTPSEFSDAITAEFQLPYGPEEFLRRFKSWPGEVFPEAKHLVRRIKPDVSCAVLSNTNEIHWPEVGLQAHFDHRFDGLFLSFETGRLKPDTASFLNVIDEYSCRPDEIFFIDDNRLNVDAARSLGIQAAHSDSGERLGEILEQTRTLI